MEKIIELITFILNISLISIGTILILIYITNKSLHHYPFYCNLLILLEIVLYNIFRIIIKNQKIIFIEIKSELKTNICYIQAFLLSFFEKLLLTTLSIDSFLTYFGTAKMYYYKINEKYFFYIFLLISIFISIFLPLLYLFKDSPKNLSEDACYPEISDYNKFIEFFFMSFLVCFNFYFILSVLFFLSEKMKLLVEGGKNLTNYNSTFIMIIFMFLLNGFLYLIFLLNINKKMFINEKYFDIFFLSTCLIVEIFYCVNKRVVRAILYIITCGYIKINNKNIEEKESETRVILTGSDGIISDLNLTI